MISDKLAERLVYFVLTAVVSGFIGLSLALIIKLFWGWLNSFKSQLKETFTRIHSRTDALEVDDRESLMERHKSEIEFWKKSVENLEHFHNQELRIRELEIRSSEKEK